MRAVVHLVWQHYNSPNLLKEKKRMPYITFYVRKIQIHFSSNNYIILCIDIGRFSCFVTRGRNIINVNELSGFTTMEKNQQIK